jgi:hypothetical protein
MIAYCSDCVTAIPRTSSSAHLLAKESVRDIYLTNDVKTNDVKEASVLALQAAGTSPRRWCHLVVASITVTDQNPWSPIQTGRAR